MEEVVKILMERDSISEEDAVKLIQEGKIAIIDALMESGEEAALETFTDFFGLEPDYILAIL